MSPKISIVVPFFNVERYIEPCLRSLAQQTLGDLEVVLVDDGSQDSSVDIARHYCERDPRFRLVRQPNAGLGPARNTGVKHATGEYITFVDSDDVVPSYAYELMVASLDRTGSQLAAGNARRFNRSGIRQSWAHRLAFKTDRPLTHIIEWPELAFDRMVWNKVYRRDYWLDFGFEFPPIRYEDYPVTFPAHLDAATIDVISAPIYFWRERDEGESITQLSHNLDNVRDRVTSALTVLDITKRRAHELQPKIHTHFAAIDVIAVAQAFASVTESDADDLLQLGQSLLVELSPASLGARARFDSIQIDALRRGDCDHLRELAQYRAAGLPPTQDQAERIPHKPWLLAATYPGRPAGSSRKRLGRWAIPVSQARLQTTVEAVRWVDADLEVDFCASIDYIDLPADSRILAYVTVGPSRVPVDVNRRLKPGASASFGSVHVPATIIAGAPKGRSSLIQIEYGEGFFRRVGGLKSPQAGSGAFPRGKWVTDDEFWMPTYTNAGLEIRRMTAPSYLSGTYVKHDRLVIQVKLGADRFVTAGTDLALIGADGRTHRLPTTQRYSDDLIEAAIPFDDFFRHYVQIDPVHARDQYRVTLMASDSDALLPILYDDSISRTAHAHGDRMLVFDRSESGHLRLNISHLEPVIDSVGVDDDGSLSVRGTLLNPHLIGHACWRIYDRDGSYRELECNVERWSSAWGATVSIEQLSEFVQDSTAPNTAHLYASDDFRGAVRLFVDGVAARDLPVLAHDNGALIDVRPGGNGLEARLV